MISRRVYATWAGIHLFLITAVCFSGLFSLVAEGATLLPSALNKYARKVELIAAFVLEKEAGRGQFDAARDRNLFACCRYPSGIQFFRA